MLLLTKEERLVLICLGVVVVLGVSTSYLLKVSPTVRDLLSVTSRYEEYLRLDVNTISYDELLAIPHIGPELAKRIIVYRKDHGALTNLNELQHIPGIGHFKFNMIKGYLKIVP